MRCDVLTLFPDMVAAILGHSILKRAKSKGLLDARVVDLRDYTVDRHRTADEAPYGGGAGMVMKPEPIFEAVEAIRRESPGAHLILTSPRGSLFTQSLAARLSREEHLVLLCGHYEGVDERVRLGLEPEEVSIGDYILTGGELPAVVILDAVTRLIPGVLGDEQSVVEESFSEDLLEYPQFTRPSEYRGMRVPEILLTGNHEAIRLWRRKQALKATRERRPDLLARAPLSPEDRRLLDETVAEGS